MPKDIKPIFLGCKNSESGEIEEDASLLTQPSSYVRHGQNCLEFSVPQQEPIILQHYDSVLLAAAWSLQDQRLFSNKFSFQFVDHGESGGCLFCDHDLDGTRGSSSSSSSSITTTTRTISSSVVRETPRDSLDSSSLEVVNLPQVVSVK